MKNSPPDATHKIQDSFYAAVPGRYGCVYKWIARDEDIPHWVMTVRDPDVFISENKEYELNEH